MYKCTRRAFVTLLALVALSSPVHGQLVDRVVAIVDQEIILHSEIEGQYAYLLERGEKDDGTLRCTIFEQLLLEKLLLAKARLDSLEVPEGRVEQELERRINRIVQQVGSQQQLEEIYQQSIYQLRADMRETIEEQLLAQQQRQAIYADIAVTPREVKNFYNRIPKDSLPLLPAEVEIGQIVMKPVANEASKAETRAKLEEIRQQIVSGEERFEALAAYYGMDGTAQQGGNLGEFGRGVMDPDFEGIAFSLDVGEVSEVFETAFGFHIVRVDKKLGDRVQARHILLIPEITQADEVLAQKKLAEVKALIESDSLTFEQAAAEYSEDEQTKGSGGLMTTRDGEYRIPLDKLDADTYLLIDPLKKGEISEPTEVIVPNSPQKFYRIVWLKNRIPPHRATLTTDYQKFQKATKQAKEATALDEWFELARRQVYIEIKPHGCSQALSNWQ